MPFPRVLIFGQPFNNFTGGGITLTNLFKGWPKDKIAVTYLGHGLQSVTTDVCDIYYQLGKDEHKWKFPFNLIQRKFPSGLKSFEGGKRCPCRFCTEGVEVQTGKRIFLSIPALAGTYSLHDYNLGIRKIQKLAVGI